jgi:hypothetical protein
MLAKQGNHEAADLADLFCRAARVRVGQLFENFYGEYDAQMYKVAQQVMRGEHSWLETGIVSLVEEEPTAPARGMRAGETVGAA